MRNKALKRGFTLIELIAVIVVLSIIIALAYPNIIGTFKDMKNSTMQVKENDIKKQAKSYIADCLEPTVKYGLSGCNNANPLTVSGYVLLSDMVNDQYIDEVKYEGTTCEAYIYFNEEDVNVCTKCGNKYETNNPSCNFSGQQEPTVSRTEFNFLASGEAQTFTAPETGKYRVELWGAQGGGETKNVGGYGGYTSGIISLTEGTKLYVYVGGQGVTNETRTNDGGINGGGFSGGWNGSYSYGGGGSTDIRYFSTTPTSEDLVWNSQVGLSSRIMVAAGGGGNGKIVSDDSYTGVSGYGGGLIGGSSIYIEGAEEYIPPTGATQVSTGIDSYPNRQQGNRTGFFGYAVQVNTNAWGGGGGGGWYGGVNGYGNPGSGGSSYISGHTGSVGITSLTDITPKCDYPTNSSSCSISPTGLKFTNTIMIDGSGYSWSNQKGPLSLMPSKVYGKYYDTGKGNEGNGLARITKISDTTPHTVKLINKDGTLSKTTLSLKSNESESVTFTQNCPLVTNPIVSCTAGAIGTISGNTLTVSNVGETTECTISPNEVVFDEDSTSTEKTFSTSCNGYYKLEVWGAQGGNSEKDGLHGGYGGYSVGLYKSTSTTTFYINIGSKPTSYIGGYNGGGTGGYGNGNNILPSGGGGGATHIATVSGLLQNLSSYKDTGGTNKSNEILIVAGGGGGADAYASGINGSSGGGSVGRPGRITNTSVYNKASGGTQTSGGIKYTTDDYLTTITDGSFGLGGNATLKWGSGGGGGWYGGGGGGASSNWSATGAGGSGYIGSSRLISARNITKHMYCANCSDEQTNPEYKTIVGECNNNVATEDCSKRGTGHARITYIGN